MKQIVQNLRSGVLELLEVPAPRVSAGHLLIQSRASLISAGTERSLVEFGKASLVAKARQNPDRVRQVLDKIKSEGLLPTLEAVFSRLDQPLPLGYCNAGVVLEIGRDVHGFSAGMRVASNAPHAEIFNQPKNLCAPIPDGVSDEAAAFTPLASIALQGIRLIAPQIGESFAVFGLGLVGLMAVQILASAGARVMAVDVVDSRLDLAEQFGATPIRVSAGADPVDAAAAFSSGHGIDGVLIAAAAKNDSIVHQSAQMCRKRGRVVLVGAVNLNLDRNDFYEKELSFQVSCSYGPGRYDEAFEVKGIDYPLPFVRWTEQRNFLAVLELMNCGRLNVAPLITSRVAHADAPRAYDALADDRTQIGIVFQYPPGPAPLERVVQIRPAASAHAPASKSAPVRDVRLGVIGAGTFTMCTLLPNLAKIGAHVESIASAGGVTATHAARKFGIATSTSDYRNILDDKRIDAVIITTRHNLHAPMVVDALAAGKHVFVEKPLAIDEAGLCSVEEALARANGLQMMVGFNRRFAPQSQKMRELLAGRTGPICANMNVNAGAIPPDAWMHDPNVGGGRVIGEGCHWFDLFCYLTGHSITGVKATQIGLASGALTFDDHMSIQLAFDDGSLAVVNYLAGGHRSYSKERMELYCDGKILMLDNFRTLRGYGFAGFRKMKLSRIDKGHRAQFAAFLERVAEGGPPLIDPVILSSVTRATFAAVRSAAGGGSQPQCPKPRSAASAAAESSF